MKATYAGTAAQMIGWTLFFRAAAGLASPPNPPPRLPPRQLSGPYKDIAAFCADFQADKAGKKLAAVPWPLAKQCFLADSDSSSQCPLEPDPTPPRGDWKELAPPAPFRGVGWFPARYHEQGVGTLAIRTGQGWFVYPQTLAGLSEVIPHTPVLLPGKKPGQALLLAEFTVERATATGPRCEGKGHQTATRFALVCGIGPSGKPSCTPPIPVGFEPWLNNKSELGRNFLQIEISAEARLTIRTACPAGCPEMPTLMRTYVGSQQLSFP